MNSAREDYVGMATAICFTRFGALGDEMERALDEIDSLRAALALSQTARRGQR
jgi:hypothetical protein